MHPVPLIRRLFPQAALLVYLIQMTIEIPWQNWPLLNMRCDWDLFVALGWAGHVARMRDSRDAYRILGGNLREGTTWKTET